MRHGESTRFLAPLARSLTALDASPKMIEHNRRRLKNPKVHYVTADIFEWRPDRRYDLVFFSFWLSHVPPRSFDGFWGFLRTCVKPGGRVAFIDEDDRGSGNDELTTIKGFRRRCGPSVTAARIPIVKLYWPPNGPRNSASATCIGLHR